MADARRVPKRMREVAKPHVLCQIGWGGADEAELRWSDSIGYVPLDKVLQNAIVAPAVRKAMAGCDGTGTMWKLRFATEDTGFPSNEDSRTLLNVKVDDDALLEAMGEFASCTGTQFCGQIVGHINVQTVM